MLRCIWGFVLFVLCGLPLVAQDMTLIITQGGLPYQSQTWFSRGRGFAARRDTGILGQRLLYYIGGLYLSRMVGYHV